jgi:hypothetical protein
VLPSCPWVLNKEPHLLLTSAPSAPWTLRSHDESIVIQRICIVIQRCDVISPASNHARRLRIPPPGVVPLVSFKPCRNCTNPRPQNCPHATYVSCSSGAEMCCGCIEISSDASRDCPCPPFASAGRRSWPGRGGGGGGVDTARHSWLLTSASGVMFRYLAGGVGVPDGCSASSRSLSGASECSGLSVAAFPLPLASSPGPVEARGAFWGEGGGFEVEVRLL